MRRCVRPTPDPPFMPWLRSLAAILLGGVLSMLLSCAGEATFSALHARTSPTKRSPAVVMQGSQRPSDDSLEPLISAPAVAMTALEPSPPSVHFLATILAALVA